MDMNIFLTCLDTQVYLPLSDDVIYMKDLIQNSKSTLYNTLLLKTDLIDV